MTISVQCVCGKQYQVADEWVGKRVKCKACDSVVVIQLPNQADDTLWGDLPSAEITAPPLSPVTPPAAPGSLAPQENSHSGLRVGIGLGSAAFLALFVVISARELEYSLAEKVETTGIVIKQWGDKTSRGGRQSRYSFRDERGQKYEGSGSDPPIRRVGASVPIRYMKSNPNRNHIETAESVRPILFEGPVGMLFFGQWFMVVLLFLTLIGGLVFAINPELLDRMVRRKSIGSSN